MLCQLCIYMYHDLLNKFDNIKTFEGLFSVGPYDHYTPRLIPDLSRYHQTYSCSEGDEDTDSLLNILVKIYQHSIRRREFLPHLCSAQETSESNSGRYCHRFR